jgi:O-antigen ligase
MATRIRYWQEFFLPAAAHHFWLGTGTTLASEVPQQLGLNVDNEYLFAVFRAGVSGLVLLIGAFIALAVIAWGERRNPDPMARALAAACAASVVTLAIVGLTSQYLTFTAVSQMFWMLVGLFAARRSPSLTYVDEGSPAQALQQPARLEAARAWR